MTGERREPHSDPDRGRVESSPRGDGVFVFTPCRGVRVFFPPVAEPIVCHQCQRAKPPEAFYLIYGAEERVQPCIVCSREPSQPEPIDSSARQALAGRRAVEAVRRASTLCAPVEGEVRAPAGFELAGILLDDALDVLTDPDLFDGLDGLPPRPQGGSQAGEAPPTRRTVPPVTDAAPPPPATPAPSTGPEDEQS